MEALKWFKENEFVMGDKNVFDQMDEQFLYKLDLLRFTCGFAFHINSSYRDKEYNTSVGGSKNSMHLLGRAVDISCTDAHRRSIIVKNALNQGLSVGVAKSFIHVDNRDEQVVFSY